MSVQISKLKNERTAANLLTSDYFVVENSGGTTTYKTTLGTIKSIAQNGVVHLTGNETLDRKTYKGLKLTGATPGTERDIANDVNNGFLTICGGQDSTNGSYVCLGGGEYPNSGSKWRGTVEIKAQNTVDAKSSSLLLSADGKMTWKGKNVVRSVAGQTADDAGNVDLVKFSKIGEGTIDTHQPVWFNANNNFAQPVSCDSFKYNPNKKILFGGQELYLGTNGDSTGENKEGGQIILRGGNTYLHGSTIDNYDGKTRIFGLSYPGQEPPDVGMPIVFDPYENVIPNGASIKTFSDGGGLCICGGRDPRYNSAIVLYGQNGQSPRGGLQIVATTGNSSAVKQSVLTIDAAKDMSYQIYDKNTNTAVDSVVLTTANYKKYIGNDFLEINAPQTTKAAAFAAKAPEKNLFSDFSKSETFACDQSNKTTNPISKTFGLESAECEYATEKTLEADSFVHYFHLDKTNESASFLEINGETVVGSADGKMSAQFCAKKGTKLTLYVKSKDVEKQKSISFLKIFEM